MNEVIFVVEEAAEGGFTARALGAAIFTEADDLASLWANIRDAVRCHFEPTRLHVRWAAIFALQLIATASII
jgi:hypothetical protein